uniref:Large polyvalent protein-associated domain-containing protein n=1 Tax=Cereibacter sphaeroides (strain ATCC 17025 / ATH 2.4.3) TaxID=349102 RepID=A4X0P8_CERS5
MAETTNRVPPAPLSARAADTPGTAEPIEPRREGADRFATPASFADRFLITKAKDRQELFRSYDASLPAIIDTGDRLATKAADRATAMDMIDLAAHRGWKSLRVAGPEDFRREMWIEASAHGIRVDGYRATDRDIDEAWRRTEITAERSSLARNPVPGGRTSIDMPEKEFDRAVRAEVARLRAEGHSRAHIAERSFEIEDGVRQRWAEAQAARPSYAEGLRGTIAATGTAPYKDREGAMPVPFVRLALDRGGEHTLWSVSLPAVLEKNGLRTGDRATFVSPGVETMTYTAKDPATGDDVAREGHRRRWDVQDIERAPQRSSAQAQPHAETSARQPQTGSPAMADKPREQDTRHDRLEDRIKRYEPGDTPVKGAASALARMDAEMRAAGVGERDREVARGEASKLIAQSLRAGAEFQVQKLANVTREQVGEAGAARSDEAKALIDARQREPVAKARER